MAVLLACPLVCLSHAAASAEAQASLAVGSRAGCDCCSGSCPRDSNDGSGKPDSRQGSGTCLCHGAVMDRHVEMPIPDHAFVTCLPSDAMAVAAEPLDSDARFVTERAACHFPVADSGREVRALIASLLL